MTPIPIRYPRDRITALESTLMEVNEERIRLHGQVAQLMAMRELQVFCLGPHSVFDSQRLRAAEDAADDLIDRLRGVVDWPPLPSSILTNGGGP